MTMSELRKLKVKSSTADEDNVGQLTISDIQFNFNSNAGNELGK